ncbi:MAG: peptidoglycan-binding protein [Candidatus Paceibacterota bacterium]
MKKILGAVVLGAMFSPVFAFAAYNDVTLTTSTVLSIGGITINISGSSAVIESITVTATSFSVVMPPGSTISLVAPNRNIMSAVMSVPATFTETCTDSTSSLTVTAIQSTTIPITPSSTLCTTPSSGGGGGGGGIIYQSPVVSTPVTTSAQKSSVTSSGVTFTTDFGIGATGTDVATLQTFLEGKGFLTMPAGVTKGTFGMLTMKALQAYQTSVGVKATGFVGPLTRAAIAGAVGANVPSTTPSSPGTGVTFTTDFGIGATGTDVATLQTFLEGKGFLTMPAGVTKGTFGMLTMKALQAYQTSVGVKATGFVGPLTRAAINAGK